MASFVHREHLLNAGREDDVSVGCELIFECVFLVELCKALKVIVYLFVSFARLFYEVFSITVTNKHIEALTDFLEGPIEVLAAQIGLFGITNEVKHEIWKGVELSNKSGKGGFQIKYFRSLFIW